MGQGAPPFGSEKPKRLTSGDHSMRRERNGFTPPPVKDTP